MKLRRISHNSLGFLMDFFLGNLHEKQHPRYPSFCFLLEDVWRKSGGHVRRNFDEMRNKNMIGKHDEKQIPSNLYVFLIMLRGNLSLRLP